MTDHPNVVHVPSLSWIEPLQAPFGNGKKFAVRAKRVAHAAGSQQLGCTFYELSPGKKTFPFHYHLAQEEALYVLEGTATLRLGDREIEIRAGDYVALPIGRAHAHQLLNDGQSVCRYLCISTTTFPEVAVYPDSNKVGLLGGVASADESGMPLIQVSRHGEMLGYYEGEDD